MTTVSAAPASPTPSKGSAGRTSAGVPGDDFAAMLAGLIGAVAPGSVTGTVTPGSVTGTGSGTLPSALSPTPSHLDAGAGSTGAPTPVAPEGVGVQGALLAAAPVTTAPVPTAASPVPSSVPSALTAAALTGADVPPGAGGHAAGLDSAPPSAAAIDVDLPPAIEQDLSAGLEPTAGDGTDDGAPVATQSTAPGVPTETSRVAGAVPVETPAAAPAPESRPVAAPTPPPPATPAPPAAVQVVQQLAPVLAGPDGSYTLSLQLYPEELGAVQVEISLRGGEISLLLHAADDVSKELLRASLGELRAQLEATGLSATDVSVHSGPAPEQDEQPGAQPPVTAESVDDSDESPAPASAPDPDAALDLRM